MNDEEENTRVLFLAAAVLWVIYAAASVIAVVASVI